MRKLARGSRKSSDYRTVDALEAIPNIGPSIAEDLRLIGISHPHDLPGEDPYALYDALCRRTATRQDPCVLDTFIAAVRFMEGAPVRPWWDYTAERKAALGGVVRGGRTPPRHAPRRAAMDARGPSPAFPATSPRPRPGSSRRRGG